VKTPPLFGTLFRVTAPHFVAGVIVNRVNSIVFAAPILHWSVGKDLKSFEAYCHHKSWTLEQL